MTAVPMPIDRQLLAGRRNRALDQRAGLRSTALERERRHAVEREQRSGADAELERVAA